MVKVAFILKGKRREREFSSPAVVKEFIKQATVKFGEDFEVALSPEGPQVTLRRVFVNTTNPDCTAADCRPSRSCNPGSSTATGRTNKGCTTRDPNRVPSSRPSRAIRSRSPNRPNPSHRPNRGQASRLSNHCHAHRSPALRGKLRRRNRTRFWTGQKSAIRSGDFGRHGRRNLSAPILRNCGLR
jgi:hypothetical protein